MEISSNEPAKTVRASADPQQETSDLALRVEFFQTTSLVETSAAPVMVDLAFHEVCRSLQ